MDYKFSKEDLRKACQWLNHMELEISLLKEMIENFKFEILGFAEEQKEKKNG